LLTESQTHVVVQLRITGGVGEGSATARGDAGMANLIAAGRWGISSIIAVAGDFRFDQRLPLTR
jgi:hypothetical protein